MTACLISVTRLLAVSAALAALLSCGGGGGSGGSQPAGLPAPTLALTPANAQNVAGDATLASLEAPDKASRFGLAAGVQSNPLPRTHVLSGFLTRQLDALVGRVPLQPALAPVPAVAEACAISGTKSTDATATGATLSFSACSDILGESISGSVTISNLVQIPNGFSASISTDLVFSFSGPFAGLPDEHFTGNYSISEAIVGTVTTITFSGPTLIMGQGPGDQIVSFTLVVTEDSSNGARTDTVSLHLESTDIGGSVNVTTLTPFQTAAGKTFPNSGAILISGAMGSAIKVTVLGDESAPPPQVRIELDANGDGVFETVLNRNWSDLSV
jgi:hypothetical protein